MGGHSGDNSCGISNKKARVCGLWDAPPIVVVVDWRLAADQLNTVCVCVYAGTPAQLHIACCRICTYVSFQVSHCQPRCCSCCRFAGVAPANSGELSMQKTVNSKQCIGLTHSIFVRDSAGGTINALTFSTTCYSHARLFEILYHKTSFSRESSKGALGCS